MNQAALDIVFNDVQGHVLLELKCRICDMICVVCVKFPKSQPKQLDKTYKNSKGTPAENERIT